MPDFKNINYLKTGNTRQKAAYNELISLKIFELLEKYKPVLAGTIPIEIDVGESDLDIICQCDEHNQFSKLLNDLFGQQNEFKIHTQHYNGIKSTIASFKGKQFEIEIFGQNLPVERQNAYRHMLIEYEILQRKGVAFKRKIIQLKMSGMKTEPAFAQLLRLTGNPYEALLKIGK